MTSTAWTEQALCAETDPEEFFPERGGSTKAAKRVCASCPVMRECLEYALEHDERFGIWGGTSSLERERLLAVRMLHRAQAMATTSLLTTT